MEQAGVQLIAQGIAAYMADMKSATGATNSFVDATESGGGRVSGASKIMTGALEKIGHLAVEAFAQAAQATAAFIGDSIGIAGDFDQKMSVLQATSGATAEEMEQLSAKAKELGSDLTLPATSAVNAGDAMLELAKAGFTVTEQMDAAKGVLQLAAAAQIDEAKAAEINANALQAFGLEAKQSIFVSDLLAASANASSINATDMADTYKMAGAIFSAFQGPVVGSKEALIDLTTAASLLGNAGIKGSDAGTALKQSLLQLTAPSDKAKGLMKALAEDIGVTGDIAYDAMGKMRSFPEILGLVSESTKGLTEENRNYIISTIFGADAARAILILMQQGPDAWDKMTAAVTQQGAAQDLAAAQTKGFNGALEGAKSQIETLQLTIGQALTPILAELLNTYISPGIAAITEFADSFFKLLPVIQASDDPLQSFLNALKILVPSALDVISVVEDVKDTIADVVKWFNQAGGAGDSLGGAVDDLSGVWEKAVMVVEAVADAYLRIAEAVLPIVAGFVAEHGDEIEAFFKSTWDTIIEIINLALDLYMAIVPPILNAIAGFIEDHGSEIQKVLSGVWDAVTSLITGALETIKGVLSLALHLIQGDWEAAWEDVKKIGQAQWDAIKGFVTGFLDAIAGIFDTTLADILQTWEDNWNMAVDIVTSIDWAQVGRDAVDGILQGLRDNWDRLLGWVADKAGDIVNAALDAIGAGSPAKEFMPVGEFATTGIMQGFSDTWPQLIDLVGGLSADLIDEMSDIGEQMQNAIADSFGSTATIDRQMAKNLDQIGDIQDEFTRKVVAQDLDTLKKKAESLFTDPKDVADYYKMVSGHEFETLKLREQIAKATTQEEKDRLNQQLILISRAQDAELDQFYTRTQGQQTVGEQIADSINAVMLALSGIDLTDDQIKIVDMLASIRSTLASTPQTMYTPGYTGQTTSNTTNVNMPIYTNNSPAALQQSWAILQASMA